jgi:hypothetical protein
MSGENIRVRLGTAQEIASDENTIALCDMVLGESILVVEHTHFFSIQLLL